MITINGKEYAYDYYTKEGEGLSDYKLEEQYEDMLNECYDMVKICGYEYEAGYALKEVDPIAFRCGFADWLSNEISEENVFEVFEYAKIDSEGI